MYIFLNILSALFWPAVIIGLVIFFTNRGRRKKHSSRAEEHMEISFSKEDSASQLFLLISFFFLGITLLAFNRDLGDLVSWRTILFISSAIGIAGAYRLKTIYTLAFSIIGVASWWGVQAAAWSGHGNVKPVGVVAGLVLVALLLYVIGHVHEKREQYKRFALVYMVFGIIAVTLTLFFFSTKTGIDAISEMSGGPSIFHSWQIVISLFILALAILGSTLYAGMHKLLSWPAALSVIAIACLFAVIALLPEQDTFIHGGGWYGSYGSSQLSPSGIVWAFIFNIAIFLELLGLIFSGYLRREAWLINLGALFLFLFIIVKYADWFFTFLDKSIFFIGAGILLFAVGWFMERGRKYVVSTIKRHNA